MPVEQRGQVIALNLGQLGQTGRSPKFQRKAAAFVRCHEPYESRGSRTDVRPGKAGMFSRGQTCRGKSQAPRSWDSRVAGNQNSEAYRRGLPGGDLRVNRAVTKVNAKVASKVIEPEGRARIRRAKAAWVAEI